MKTLTNISIILTLGLLAGCGQPSDAEASQPIVPKGGTPLTSQKKMPQSTQRGPSAIGASVRERSGAALLLREDVQVELLLNQEQIASIQEMDGRETMIDKRDEVVRDVLDEEQYARYRQINFQRRGYSSLTTPDVIEELALRKDQITAVKQALTEQVVSGANAEMLVRLRDEMVKKIDAVLTDEQKTEWAVMLGEKFEFTS